MGLISIPLHETKCALMSPCPLEVMASFLLAPVAMYSQFHVCRKSNHDISHTNAIKNRKQSKTKQLSFQQNKNKLLFFTLFLGFSFYKVITSLNTEENCSQIQ